MATVRVAAVQASYVLMDQQATLDKVAELTGKAAGQGAQLVAFPEVFIPGTPRASRCGWRPPWRSATGGGEPVGLQTKTAGEPAGPA